MKILVINGPNINMLGIREPNIYGKGKYRDLIRFIKKSAKDEGIKVSCFQSNCEGEIVTKIQWAYKKFDAIVINPAAFTHTSIAILDALKAVGMPFAEVHISKVEEREEYRQISYIRPFANFTITGKGFEGYKQALINLKSLISDVSNKLLKS